MEKKVQTPKQEVTPVTYEVAHNKAVRQFKKMSIFILWAGVLNVISALIAIFQASSDYSFCFAFNNAIFLKLEDLLVASPALLKILIISIAVVSGAIFAAVGYFASLGHRVFLFGGAIAYFLDFVVLFIFIAPSNGSFLTSILIHAMLMVAIGMSLFAYFSVLAIEKKFNKE